MAIKPIEILIRAKDEASSVFGSLQSRAAAVGAAIVGYFGFSAFVGAVKGAADLEAKLSEVQAVSGASADEMARLRQAAEAAGATTKFTATEGAEALGNLARAGLTATQAIDALPATLQLAEAGGLALADASSIVTKTLSGFGLEAANAGRIADVLAMGANASNTSVKGLAEALSYAAPTAVSLGLSLETTVAIIGKFADAGIDASRAGTALNSILSQFSDPASKFRTELAAAGITTSNFEKALGQLAAAGPKGQKAILAVGIEAGPALRALLNQGMGALDELRGKLQGAQGSAAATAAVMRDNLNGSISSLSSAWDTLKNALATPVLPVLKSAVDSLSASFAEAVNSGLITRFGETISRGFESAITWGKAFLAQVDFEAMGQSMRAYADRVGEAFDRIQQAAVNAGNVVQTAWGVMTAGGNAVMTAAYTVGEAFAGVLSNLQSGIALVLTGLAKITFGSVSASFAAAAADMKLSADATWASSQALADKGRQSFIAMGEGAEMARNGWAGLTDSVDESAVATATAQRVIEATATSLKAMGGDAQASGQQAAVAATAQKEAAEQARAKVAALRAEYESAVNSGNWQLAAEKIAALKAATEAAAVSTGALKNSSKDAADAVAAAFAGMGIKTKAELEALAATAKTRFELIKGSGQATAEGVATAWKAMTEAAIAANGGVATATQKAEAAMYGLRIEADATGKSIVQAMDQGAGATYRLSEVVKLTAAQVQANADAVDRLNMKYMQSSQYSERQIQLLDAQVSAQERLNAVTQRAIDLENKRRNVDSEGFSLNTAGQRVTAGVQTEESLFNALKAQGVDEATARQKAPDLKRQYELWAKGASTGSTMGSFSAGELMKDSWLTKPFEEVIAKTAREAASQVGTMGRSTANPSAANQTGTTGAYAASTPAKTYNVQIGARTVRTASDADAQALLGALKDARLSA